MDRLDAKSGFLPGLFGSDPRARPRSRGSDTETKRSKSSSKAEMKSPRPLGIIQRLPNGPRNHFIAMCGEFVGTFLFLFFAFAGTQVANTPQSTKLDNGNTSITITGPNPSQLLYISLAFGFSLAVNAWVFFRVSGGLFNPAVTFGLCLVGAVPLFRGGLIFIAQMFGAMAAAGVVSALFPGPLNVTTTLGAGTNLAQGVFIEMFLTAQLVFTIIMLAAEKHKATFLAPVGIGLSLFIAELAGVYYTGGSLNPARSFGPCVANTYFPSDHWIYWVGPLLGALLAAGFYWFIKALEYETANPGQDFDDLEASAFNPEEDITRPVVSPTVMLSDSVAGTDLESQPFRDRGQSQGRDQEQSVSRERDQRQSRDRFQSLGTTLSNQKSREEATSTNNFPIKDAVRDDANGNVNYHFKATTEEQSP